MKKFIATILLASAFTAINAQTAIPEFKNKVMVLTANNSLETLESTTVSFVSKGFARGHIGVSAVGPSSSVIYSTKSGSSFIVKIDPGVDPESVITLYKFTVKKKNRIIDILSTGFYKTRYEDQQIIKLNFKKVQDGVYIITANLEPGEYFFSTREPGVGGSIPMPSGFAFSVKE